jgi:hypothetical protein
MRAGSGLNGDERLAGLKILGRVHDQPVGAERDDQVARAKREGR